MSLADILSLRDRGLSEQEAWAVCLECSLSMRSVAHAAIFQTLCITPDTLAFNTSGNVCFMEQLSGEEKGSTVGVEDTLCSTGEHSGSGGHPMQHRGAPWVWGIPRASQGSTVSVGDTPCSTEELP